MLRHQLTHLTKISFTNADYFCGRKVLHAVKVIFETDKNLDIRNFVLMAT